MVVWTSCDNGPNRVVWIWDKVDSIIAIAIIVISRDGGTSWPPDFVIFLEITPNPERFWIVLHSMATANNKKKTQNGSKNWKHYCRKKSSYKNFTMTRGTTFFSVGLAKPSKVSRIFEYSATRNFTNSFVAFMPNLYFPTVSNILNLLSSVKINLFPKI